MEDKDDLHGIRERFAKCQSAWAKDRERYRDDVLFAAGDGHWPEEILKERERDGRPCLKVDKLGQYVRQIVNDSRQNRPSIKVRPVDDEADIDTADIIQGLCRHIEDRSNAQVAYDTALECAVKGGMGYIRILTEYAHEKTFNQEICLKRVRNPLTVWLDPDHQEPDGSDCNFAFVTEDIDKDEYEETYKGKSAIDFDSDAGKYGDWFGDKIRVAEYWWVEKVSKPLHLLEDGTTATDEEIEQAVAEGYNPPAIKETRQIPQRVVKWAKVNGAEYLDKPITWPGKWIPIVPVWGNEEDIDGELRHTGLIHNAKDAQRLYDYSRSAFAERVALTPKAPYIVAEGQVEDYEEEWTTANQVNYSVLRYKPIDNSGHPVPPPMRQQAHDIPAGFAQDMQLSEHDIQASIGMYSASLGEKSNEKSGRAIIARQREGDVATFHYHDNLARAIRHAGRIIVDLAPKIYDSQRVVRILGLDGTPDMATLDPTLPVSKLKVGAQTIYNLGVGTYDVSVTVGPSYTTRRQEAADSMIGMTQANPNIWATHGDLITKAMDWPDADQFAERFKLLLPPQIQQAEQQDQEVPPEVQAVIAQAQQAIAEKDQMLQQAMQQMQELAGQVQELQQGLVVKQEANRIDAQKLEIDMYNAETQRITALANADAKENDLQIKVEQLVSQRLDQLIANQMRPTE